MVPIEQFVRGFAVGQLVTLFTIDLSRQGGGFFYFTDTIFEERIPVSFGGQVYTHLPIVMEDVAVDSKSSPAQPRLSMATAGGPVAALLAEFNDLRGARVTRAKVFDDYLDQIPDGEGGLTDNPDADPSAVFGTELFVVDRKIGADHTFAELQLVAPTDQDGVMLPLRIVRKRWCDSDYRVFDPQTNEFSYVDPADGGCPWGQVDADGGAYYDENDQPCAKAKDRCSKLLSGCKLRYGAGGELPATMCPGVRAPQEAG